ncbi:MAG TPA: oxidoreductase [Verrucomicrobiales bacterium]|nr:oxidoreductase [Verrucomicrobiales bacterium]
MLNVGIVGMGFMAAMHVKAWKQVEGTRIAAICNPSGKHLDGNLSHVFEKMGSSEKLQIDMKDVQIYSDFSSLLADPDIQIVDICSPTWAHADQATAALAAGNHVLLEKPMARTAREAQRVVETASHANTFLLPGMCLRFWPEWRLLKDAIADHRYGRVLAARFRRIGPPPVWGQNHFHDGIKSGGALLDLHIHDVDFIQWCFGRPSRVYSRGYSKFSNEIDHVVTQYDVDGGAIVHAEGGWAMAPGFSFSMAYTVNFERATMDFDSSRGPDKVLVVCEQGKEPVTKAAAAEDGYLGEIRHLVECVRKNEPPSVITPVDGLTAIEICETEAHSIRLGQPVTF